MALGFGGALLAAVSGASSSSSSSSCSWWSCPSRTGSGAGASRGGAARWWAIWLLWDKLCLRFCRAKPPTVVDFHLQVVIGWARQRAGVLQRPHLVIRLCREEARQRWRRRRCSRGQCLWRPRSCRLAALLLAALLLAALLLAALLQAALLQVAESFPLSASFVLAAPAHLLGSLEASPPSAQALLTSPAAAAAH